MNQNQNFCAIVSVVFLLIGSSTKTAAQQKGFAVGVITGIDRHIILDPDQNTQMANIQYLAKTSGKLGLGVSWYFHNNFGVRTEMNLLARGGIFNFRGSDDQGNPASVDIDYHLNYFQLPLLFQVSYGRNRLTGFSQVGEYFAFKWNEKRDFYINGEKSNTAPIQMTAFRMTILESVLEQDYTSR